MRTRALGYAQIVVFRYIQREGDRLEESTPAGLCA